MGVCVRLIFTVYLSCIVNVYVCVVVDVVKEDSSVFGLVRRLKLWLIIVGVNVAMKSVLG